MLTTTKLPHHLQIIKRKLGLTLINFENATIELEPFIKKHPFENSQFLMHSIVKHYKDVRDDVWTNLFARFTVYLHI